MTIERKHNGILIYDVVNRQLVKMFYQGYTLRQAKKNFALLIESVILNKAYVN